MEPSGRKNTNGLAPVIGWSASPSLATSPENTTPLMQSPLSSGIEDDLQPTSPSNGSAYSRGLSVGITENPNYDRVKFIDVPDHDSIISSTTEICIEDLGRKKPKIPDGGWGWVVVFSSLVISMIADGISFSFGLLYIEFLDEFGASKSKTAWIGSLFMAVPLLSGPVMSTLVDRYGCRSMTIVGGIVSGLGFVFSAYVNSIEMMYLTFGVIAGLGLGLCYVTAVVSIAYWFDKKRTLATGLGACGTGVGTFVYAPMTQYFIEQYGWRGTTLLLAGTFFNMCVCGAVMRAPAWWTKEQKRLGSSTGGTKTRNSSVCGSVSGRSGADGESNFPGVEEIQKLLKSGKTPEYILTTLVTSMEPQNPETPKEHFQSVVNLPTFIKQSEKVPFEVLETLISNKRLYNVIVENYPSLLACRSVSDNGLNKLLDNTALVRHNVPVTMSVRLKQANNKGETVEKNPVPAILPANPLETKINLLPRHHGGHLAPHHVHYLRHIRIHRNSVMYRGAALNIHKYRLKSSSCPNIYRNSMTTLAIENEEKWYAEFVELLKGMFDFSLFLEFHFLLLSLSTILLFTWFIVPYFYLAEHLTRNDYTESEASVLISIIGVTNTIGMIGLGWAGDRPWLHVAKAYAVCLVLCGISILAIIAFTNMYVPLAISCASFGLFFASNYSFTPTLLVELVPLENFTTAYGLILLCQGIGNLIGPPVAGWLFDITQTWDMSFYHAGCWIILSGMLLAIIPYTGNRMIIGNSPLMKEKDNYSYS